MRKISILTIILIALFAISACKKATTTSTTTGITTGTTTGDTVPVTYKDGTYTAEGDKRQYGYEDATVVIENGKITQITLRRLSSDGTEVDYSQWDGSGDRPNLKQFRLDMAAKMLEEQNPNVDTIAGATDSSAGWIIAVDRALQKARA